MSNNVTFSQCNNILVKDFNDGSITSGNWKSFWTGTTTTENWGEWEIFGGNVASAGNFDVSIFQNYACESWMVSPLFDLPVGSAPQLVFDNMTRYSGNALELYISNDYDGFSNPSLQGTWFDITGYVPNWDTDNSSWSLVSSGNTDLTTFIGPSVAIAFKYIGTNSDGATWEVDNIKIENLGNPISVVDSISSCDSYTWIDGNTYTSSVNTPTFTLTNAAGCDSIVTLNLTINNIPSPDFTSNVSSFTSAPFLVEFSNITPNLSDFNFTWDFGDNSTLQSNNPLVFHEYQYNGLYDVFLIAENIVTGCTDTMLKTDNIYCTGGPSVSITEVSNQINIFPNPTNENITISVENFNGNIKTEIYDLIGIKLQTTNETTISLQDYAIGIYLLKVAYGDRVEEVKVIKD